MNSFNLKKILIIKHGSLGDVISSTSAIYDIKNHFRDCKISILTTKNYQNFFKDSNLIDEILIDDRKNILRSISIVKKIIKLKFYMVIDLQNSQRTFFYEMIIRLFSRSKINGTGIFATHRFKNNHKKLSSVIEGLSDQIELLNIKTSRKPYLDWLNNKSFDFNQLSNKRFFIINPGCSLKNSQKKWPALNYSKICSYLISKDILPIIIGYDQDRQDIKKIEKQEPRVLNLLDKSPLDVVFQLSKKAIGAISNDTGPAHLIAASGCKLHLILSNFSNINTVTPQGKNVSFTQKKNINNIFSEDIIQKLNHIFEL